MAVPTSFCVISKMAIFELQKNWLIRTFFAYRVNSDKEEDYTLEFYISLLFHHLYYNSKWQNEVEILNKGKPFATYRNYQSSGLTLPNFTFQLLLETMKPNKILELVQCLLLEKKIILVKSQYSDNAIIIESILSLMFPLY